MKSLWSILFLLLAAGAALYLFAAAYLYFGQKSMVFYPSRLIDVWPDSAGLVYEDIYLETGDGVALRGWYVPADDPRGTLLFLHGNAGNIANRVTLIGFYHRLGVNVFIIDYRGYGLSAGDPSEEGTYLDARAAWEYLLNKRGEVPRRIVILGRSLGAAIAAKLAATVPQAPAGVILEGAFTSVPDMGARLYPWLPVRALARFHYPTRKYAERITAPALVIHSSDDEITPLEMGRQVYEALTGEKRFAQMTGGHDDAYIVSEESYRTTLEEFLVETLPHTSPNGEQTTNGER